MSPRTRRSSTAQGENTMAAKDSASSRDAYVAKMKTQLDERNAELARMEEKGRKASDDAKVQYEKSLQDLRKRQEEAQQKLTQIQQANVAAWEDLKGGAEAAWTAMEASMKQAWSRFK
jgi:hypothetical protein